MCYVGRFTYYFVTAGCLFRKRRKDYVYVLLGYIHVSCLTLYCCKYGDRCRSGRGLAYTHLTLTLHSLRKTLRVYALSTHTSYYINKLLKYS